MNTMAAPVASVVNARTGARMPRFIDRSTNLPWAQKSWREILQIMVRTCSWNQAAEMFRSGRVPDLAWHGFVRVWHFNSILFSSERQMFFYDRHGLAALRQRINRTRAAFGFLAIADARS